MSAWLYLVPKPDDSGYTKQELIDLLGDGGVRYGVNTSNLAAMAAKGIYHRYVLVAKGREPEEGREGYYEFLFDAENDHKHPKILEDGSADYQSMSVLDNVEEGAILAIYHPAESGEPGTDVGGKPIDNKAVKDLPALKCVGCNNKNDPNVYVAEREGKVEYDDGKLSVVNVYSISGDVDLVTGKVEFFGDLVITGNVAAGVVIRAGKTLTIMGTVECANIFAGGDIILKRGVQGNNKGRVVSRGNIFTDFAEHCTLEAAGDVTANVLLNSEVKAGGKIILTGKKGCILGGHAHATHGIVATDIGNDVELPTAIHTGVNPKMYEERLELNKKLSGISDEVNELVEEMVLLMRKRNASPLLKQEEMRLEYLKEHKDEIQKTVKEIQADLKDIEQKIAEAQGSSVRVEGTIYRGVSLGIDNETILIKQNDHFMEYSRKTGVIAGEVIVI